MFDYLHCKYPLPIAGANRMVFQTKDTPAQYCEQYTISEDGQLFGQEYDIEDRSDPNAEGIMRMVGCMTRVNIRDVPITDFTGEINFYSDYGKKDNCGWGHGWMEFSSYFISGKIQSITLVENREPPSDLCERCGGSGWERIDFSGPTKRCQACSAPETQQVAAQHGEFGKLNYPNSGSQASRAEGKA